MEAFLRVVIDSGAQGFKIATSAAWITTMLGISRARLSVDLREHLAAPIFVQTFDPRLNLLLFARLADIRQTD